LACSRKFRCQLGPQLLPEPAFRRFRLVTAAPVKLHLLLSAAKPIPPPTYATPRRGAVQIRLQILLPSDGMQVPGEVEDPAGSEISASTPSQRRAPPDRSFFSLAFPRGCRFCRGSFGESCSVDVEGRIKEKQKPYSTWRLEVQHQLRSSELALLPASPALDATVKVFPRLL
jgi:hypothetical protein